MSDCATSFFDAWRIEDDESRLAKITGAVTENVRYDDPRTPESIIGVPDLNSYVGMFSANAPGWSAKVIKSDSISDCLRVTVAFSGTGPDGTEQVQLGQYFLEEDKERLSRIVGFVGTGETE
ncbi:MAG: hypothetical protein AAF991_07345 [Pseudomonadota bacterium]